MCTPRKRILPGARRSKMSKKGRPPVAKKPPKVAVLMGGIGQERDISLQSGTSVAEALKEAGFNVVAADIRPDKTDILEDASIDVFFPALHGQFGEDGQLQQMLEDRSLVYAGSGPRASSLAFDKMAGKQAFYDAGVAAPPTIEFKHDTDIPLLLAQLPNFADKYVIKPIRQGSSVGIRMATEPAEAVSAARETLREFGGCMIEKFVPGREVTVGILCDQPLPLIEIRAASDFYDYNAKYMDDKTQFLFDTIDDPALVANIQAAALDCFDALGCRHFARVDFILSEQEIAYALEVNTIPGFTTHSLLPKAAQRAGLSMSDLCAKIVETALLSSKKKQSLNPPMHNKT
jgi:D-alanine-D-alanine ligase